MVDLARLLPNVQVASRGRPKHNNNGSKNAGSNYQIGLFQRSARNLSYMTIESVIIDGGRLVGSMFHEVVRDDHDDPPGYREPMSGGDLAGEQPDGRHDKEDRNNDRHSASLP
jgi:hypothetical protein